ncbi:MAG TPA: hypothetical protein VLX30_16655 [Burkholderiales bacterium]|nr:hypothetical protein [Burkholderiales bacterium]
MPASKRYLVTLASLALVAGCASYPPAPAPMASVPAPRLYAGERWVYEQINPYNDLRVRTLTDTVETGSAGYTIVRRSDRPGDAPEVETLAAPWRVAEESTGSSWHSYSPPLTEIPFPIAPGTSWKETLVMTNTRGSNRWQQCWGRALRWERVSTPAGEFVALRIEFDRNLGDRTGDWDYTYTYETLWYAPAVKRWVRREWRKRRQELKVNPLVEVDAIVWQLTAYR